jgi:hypothetical protein
MRTKTLTVQSMQEMTENRAKACQVPGHSPSSHARCPALFGLLVLLIVAAGCNSAKNTLGESGTSIQGMWTVTGNLGAQSGSETYQVAFVPSPCSVMSPVGTFSVQGPVCFIANNNTGQGSISGKGLLSNSNNTGEGVLIGVASDPVPANATFNLLFVLGEQNGNFVEFTGSGTIANGTMTGTGSCSPGTPLCQGSSGTFSGNQQ